ncbi:MAG TPA: phosphosulfolactate synthase [Chitinophagales bacterium]|nr:phosphosulfolactate synthase [Chitinophagales bacterium]
MKFVTDRLPARTRKPRTVGITMVMDKGLSAQEAVNFLSVNEPHVDIVKLGFGTAAVTPNLQEKISVYKNYKVPVYFGGTLLEWFYAHNALDDYVAMLDEYEVEYAEVSDGTLEIPHDEKCRIISQLAKSRIVLSEVGSKDAEKIIPPYKWIQLMKEELEAGANMVIAEAREGGNVGIYRGTGEVREGLVEEILTQIPAEKILWEAPNKAQQVFFIKLLGSDVNLGNIPVNEVIPLETLRVGLRGDTMKWFLEK